MDVHVMEGLYSLIQHNTLGMGKTVVSTKDAHGKEI